jgi:hypothetical protein
MVFENSPKAIQRDAASLVIMLKVALNLPNKIVCVRVVNYLVADVEEIL